MGVAAGKEVGHRASGKLLMKQVDYEAKDGRKFRVQVPDDCPENMYKSGIPVGPPDIDHRLAGMGWPKELRVRLHNQLHARKLFTLRDLMRKPQDIEGALKATLKVALQAIPQWYREEGG